MYPPVQEWSKLPSQRPQIEELFDQSSNSARHQSSTHVPTNHDRYRDHLNFRQNKKSVVERREVGLHPLAEDVPDRLLVRSGLEPAPPPPVAVVVVAVVAPTLALVPSRPRTWVSIAVCPVSCAQCRVPSVEYSVSRVFRVFRCRSGKGGRLGG